MARRFRPFGCTIFLLAAVSSPCPAQVPHFSLDSILTIGKVDGPDALSEVGDVAVDFAGRAYVSQPGDLSIRVFSAQGERLHRIGGAGGGPGEFRSVDRIGFQDDLFYAIDRTLNRISWFDPESGAFVRSAPLPRIPSEHPIVFAGPQFLLAAGNLLTIGASIPEIMTRLDEIPTVRSTMEGVIMDTLQPIWWRNRSVLFEEGGSRAVITHPLHSASRFDVSADGAAFVTVTGQSDSTFVVVLSVAPAWKATSHLFRYRPLRLSSEQRASILAALHEDIGTNPLIGLSRAQLREAIDFPEFLPPVDHVSAMSDGTIWLSLADADAETTEWLVLDRSAAVVMRVSGPDVTLVAAAGDSAWGILHDELDVPYVRRYRLRPDP